MSSTAPSARPKGAGSKGTGGLLRVLNWIEWLGNKLPDPFWLFLMLAGIVLLLSWILSAVGLSAVNPATGETVAVTNLLSPEGLRKMVSEAVTNFVEFPPLGLVIVVLLIGTALLIRSMNKQLRKLPKSFDANHPEADQAFDEGTDSPGPAGSDAVAPNPPGTPGATSAAGTDDRRPADT